MFPVGTVQLVPGLMTISVWSAVVVLANRFSPVLLFNPQQLIFKGNQLCQIMLTMAYPFAVKKYSSEGYISGWYGCPADSYEIVVIEACFVIHKDESDVAGRVVAVTDVAVTLIDLYRKCWYDSFHLGFLASRVDMSWMSLGRHRYTSCPAMVNASDHTICMADSFPLSLFSSAKIKPLSGWTRTRSGKPA